MNNLHNESKLGSRQQTLIELSFGIRFASFILSCLVLSILSQMLSRSLKGDMIYAIGISLIIVIAYIFTNGYIEKVKNRVIELARFLLVLMIIVAYLFSFLLVPIAVDFNTMEELGYSIYNSRTNPILFPIFLILLLITITNFLLRAKENIIEMKNPLRFGAMAISIGLVSLIGFVSTQYSLKGFILSWISLVLLGFLIELQLSSHSDKKNQKDKGIPKQDQIEGIETGKNSKNGKEIAEPISAKGAFFSNFGFILMYSVTMLAFANKTHAGRNIELTLYSSLFLMLGILIGALILGILIYFKRTNETLLQISILVLFTIIWSGILVNRDFRNLSSDILWILIGIFILLLIIQYIKNSQNLNSRASKFGFSISALLFIASLIACFMFRIHFVEQNWLLFLYLAIFSIALNIIAILYHVKRSKL